MKNLINSVIILAVLTFGVKWLYLYQYNKAYIETLPINFVTLAERDRQLKCLAENIFYEANSESAEGKILVAQVTINRANSKLFPNDICLVVHQKSQFSWTAEIPKALVRVNKHEFEESMNVAKRVLLEGYRLDSVKNSLFYHADYISQPVWAKNLHVDIKIGHHIAYSKPS